MSTDCWNEIGVHGAGTATCPALQQVIHCHNCEVFARAGRGLLDQLAPSDYLAIWSDALAQQKSAPATARVSMFVFRVGPEWFSLPTSVIQEVALTTPVRTLPHRMSDLLSGLVNVRGELHLCFSMARLLKVAGDESPGAPRMIVIAWNGQRWAFPADEAWGIHWTPEETLREVPVTIARDHAAHVRGILPWERGNISCLDERLLFATLERRATVGGRA